MDVTTAYDVEADGNKYDPAVEDVGVDKSGTRLMIWLQIQIGIMFLKTISTNTIFFFMKI